MSSSSPTAAAEGSPPPGSVTGIDVTFLMPCLNEARTLPTCIAWAQEATALLEAQGLISEILISDNGSEDGSTDIARANGCRVTHCPSRGYGAALIHGCRAARGRYIVMGDADASYDFRQAVPMVQRLADGCDLCMGNRFEGGIEPGAMPWKNRYIGNPVLSGVLNLFFHTNIHDAHCGLRAFRRDAFERMRLTSGGMEFASEMVVKAALLKMRCDEVPITLHPDGRGRPPHLRPWRDGWRHLRFLLLLSPRWLFLYPGLMMMAAGSALGLWLLGGPREVAGVGLDIHTLLYAAMGVMLGFQAVAFAIFSKAYGVTRGLLPEDPRLERLWNALTLERGLMLGGLLAGAGLACAIWTVVRWSRVSFGELNPAVILRAAIPSVVMLTLGGQVILFSFLLSLIRLGQEREP